jgi:hypothetical protein
MKLTKKAFKLNKIKTPSGVFDTTISSWETLRTGPMSNSTNQGLSYHVFICDKQVFEQKYPHLKIVCQGLILNYLKYLSSRVLNSRQTFLSNCTKFSSTLKRVTSPLNRLLTPHHLMMIRKI